VGDFASATINEIQKTTKAQTLKNHLPSPPRGGNPDEEKNDGKTQEDFSLEKRKNRFCRPIVSAGK
jgi:hypothetical protein